MKIIFQIFGVIMLLAQNALSNNVQVGNVRLTGQDTAGNFTMVEFDITWENSWRYSNGPANWDAVWIFVKYRVGTAGAWQHAWLNNTGHIACGNGTIANGLLSPELPYNTSTNPSLGVFLFRSAPGSGVFSCQDVQLRWNYGANSLGDNEQIDIRVFAIEMVYVPQGQFKVGDGNLTGGTLYQYNSPGQGQPYTISNESEIVVGPSNGNLYYDNDSGYSGDRLGPIPSAYPKGFKAFYMMKYELSQQGYVDFLNNLTRIQQASRVRSDISGTNVTNQFVMNNANDPDGNGIWSLSVIPMAPSTVLFYCNFNDNLIPNEIGDGHTLAGNYILWKDIFAYLDWSALRPMTELEFEKGGRGVAEPVLNEFSWGNNYIRNAPIPSNNGFPNSLADSLSNVNAGISSNPYRVGIFARANSNRTFSGAGYYGAMELTGNVWERVITIGNPQGRSFQGTHGNGLLDINGNANVTSWPDPTSGLGIGNRGGGPASSIDTSLAMSNRFQGAADLGFGYNFGGRGVRTAP